MTTDEMIQHAIKESRGGHCGDDTTVRLPASARAEALEALACAEDYDTCVDLDDDSGLDAWSDDVGDRSWRILILFA